MFTQSTAQLLAQQYRERIPSPYVGMKEGKGIHKNCTKMNGQILSLAPLGVPVKNVLLIARDPIHVRPAYQEGGPQGS